MNPFLSWSWFPPEPCPPRPPLSLGHEPVPLLIQGRLQISFQLTLRRRVRDQLLTQLIAGGAQLTLGRLCVWMWEGVLFHFEEP